MSDLLTFLLFIAGLLLAAACGVWLLFSRGFPIFDAMLDGLTYTEAREKTRLERQHEREKSLQKLHELRNKKQ